MAIAGNPNDRGLFKRKESVMRTVEYATSRPLARWRPRFLQILGSVLALALIAIAVLLTSTHQSAPATPNNSLPPGVKVSSAHISTERFNGAQVFTERVEPVLSVLRKKNDEAVQRAVGTI